MYTNTMYIKYYIDINTLSIYLLHKFSNIDILRTCTVHIHICYILLNFKIVDCTHINFLC